MARSSIRRAGNCRSLPTALWDSHYLRACRGEASGRTPVWLMRQAGRYMAEYRAVRAEHDFLQMCYRPEIAAEVTVTAQRVIDADAAIIFADILLILDGLGLDLSFVGGVGPQLQPTIAEPADVDRLGEPTAAAEHCAAVAEACRLTRRDLPADVPLIGFSGAPFTVAAYAIEGGGSRQFAATRRFMYQQSAAWHRLCERIVDASLPYVVAQLDAGAQALQFFDSWAGVLPRRDYEEFALPHLARLVDSLPDGAPVTVFGTNSSHLLPSFATTGADVIGVDSVTDLAAAWELLGGVDRVAIQGNLDPALLLADRDRLLTGADAVLEAAAGRPGHIFNLGHGVFKETDVEQVVALIEHVHARSRA